MFLQRYQSGVVRKAPVKRDRGDLQLGMAEGHVLLPETETRGGKDYVPAFIRIANTSMDRLPALGVLVDSRFDGFVSARIPVDKLEAVAALEGVSEVSVSTVAEVETDQGSAEDGRLGCHQQHVAGAGPWPAAALHGQWCRSRHHRFRHRLQPFCLQGQGWQHANREGTGRGYEFHGRPA